jgi:hypothetical protein
MQYTRYKESTVLTTLTIYRFFVLKIILSISQSYGLVVRVLGYRSGAPGSISGTTKKKVMGLERSPLSLVSK